MQDPSSRGAHNICSSDRMPVWPLDEDASGVSAQNSWDQDLSPLIRAAGASLSAILSINSFDIPHPSAFRPPL